MDLESYDFINSFKEEFYELEKYIKFTPHYALWYCIACEKNNYTENNYMCISGGRYCSPDRSFFI